MDKRPIAVLGAGNVGLAMSAFLAQRGYPVHLYNAFSGEIEALRVSGQVHAEGFVDGVFRLAKVTTDMGDALAGAQLAIVTVPIFAHRVLIEAALPHLDQLEYLVLHPGLVGSALAMDTLIQTRRPGARVVVGEATSSLFSCRKLRPGSVHVRTVKHRVRVAALPATDTPGLLNMLDDPFESRFDAAESVLETSMNNINPVYHSPVMVANYGRVEAGEKWYFADVVTPGIARLIEAADHERVALARALGVSTARSFPELMEEFYGVAPSDLMTQLRAAYLTGGGSPLPIDPMHRFLSEDIPYGMVPYVALGELTGVNTPVIRATVEYSCALHGRNWWAEGTDLKSLGLTDLASLQRRVMGGRF